MVSSLVGDWTGGQGESKTLPEREGDSRFVGPRPAVEESAMVFMSALPGNWIGGLGESEVPPGGGRASAVVSIVSVFPRAFIEITETALCEARFAFSSSPV